MIRKYLSKSRETEIAELVSFIFEEYKISENLNLDQLLNDLKITISYGDYEDAFDGLLEYNNGFFHIFCNEKRLNVKNSPRSRFTIAHELGHYFIEEHRLALISGNLIGHCSFSDYQSDDIIEQEADFFATSLLLPELKFQNLSKKRRKGFDAILFLSDFFRTSITSTAIRFVSLNLAPCLIIKWKDNEYQWKQISDDFRFDNYKKTIEVYNSSLRGSATEKAFKSSQNPDNGFFESITTASIWFPCISNGSYKDILLIEQAIKLGSHGIITFLSPSPEQL